jgi:hypothetical protein
MLLLPEKQRERERRENNKEIFEGIDRQPEQMNV